jgi:hypothetical protein
MHDKPSGAHDERATTTAEMDDRDQAAVLREVLFIYPEVLTLDELARQMAFAMTMLSRYAHATRRELFRRAGFNRLAAACRGIGMRRPSPLLK